MKAEVDIARFLDNLDSYALGTAFDYTYYLILSELERLQTTSRIGNLKPGDMNPIVLLLRDWMPGGWVAWSEKTGKRWQMNTELCDVLNRLKNEFSLLSKIDLISFKPDQNGPCAERIYEKIFGLKWGVSEKAVATVTSKILHLLVPKLFVMWDTKIIDFFQLPPNADGYLKFLVKMQEVGKQLQQHQSEIREKTEELRKRASEIFDDGFCSEKSLAKLIDESNWIETRK